MQYRLSASIAGIFNLRLIVFLEDTVALKLVLQTKQKKKSSFCLLYIPTNAKYV
jgi:hypothetical protein